MTVPATPAPKHVELPAGPRPTAEVAARQGTLPYLGPTTEAPPADPRRTEES
ncbi:hypothetical protein [Kitasatospora sp. P5_F3]